MHEMFAKKKVLVNVFFVQMNKIHRHTAQDILCDDISTDGQAGNACLQTGQDFYTLTNYNRKPKKRIYVIL